MTTGFSGRDDQQKDRTMDEMKIYECSDGKACVVLIDGGDDPLGEPSIAIGVALCHPEDSYDEEIGFKLANSRAIKHMGERLVRVGKEGEAQARAEVDWRDEQRERQAEAQADAHLAKMLKKAHFQQEFASLIEYLYPGTFEESPQAVWNKTQYNLVEDFIASSRA